MTFKLLLIIALTNNPNENFRFITFLPTHNLLFKGIMQFLFISGQLDVSNYAAQRTESFCLEKREPFNFKDLWLSFCLCPRLVSMTLPGLILLTSFRNVLGKKDLFEKFLLQKHN